MFYYDCLNYLKSGQIARGTVAVSKIRWKKESKFKRHNFLVILGHIFKSWDVINEKNSEEPYNEE